MRIKWKKKVHPARISCVSKKEPSATESKSKSKPNHHIYRNIKYTSRQMALCCNSTPNLIHKICENSCEYFITIEMLKQRFLAFHVFGSCEYAQNTQALAIVLAVGLDIAENEGNISEVWRWRIYYECNAHFPVVLCFQPQHVIEIARSHSRALIHISTHARSIP